MAAESSSGLLSSNELIPPRLIVETMLPDAGNGAWKRVLLRRLTVGCSSLLTSTLLKRHAFGAAVITLLTASLK